MPVRMGQTGFSDDEWTRIAAFLAKGQGITLYELLKRGALEYIIKYQDSPNPDVPKAVLILVDDLKTWDRKVFDRRANVTWLKGRHGVTENVANEALRIYEAEVLTL